MRYFRRQLAHWLPAWISILILIPPSARAQGESGKVSTESSVQIVEKCRYNERELYVCEDVVVRPLPQKKANVVVRPPSQKENVPQTATSNAAQTAPSAHKTLDVAEEQKNVEALKKYIEELKKLEYDVLIQKRDTLQEDIKKKEEQLDALRQIRYLLPELKIEQLRGDRGWQQDIQVQIAHFEEVASLEKDEAYDPSAPPSLKAQLDTDLRLLKEKKESVNSEINFRLNTTARAQDFKKTISLYSAVIVAVVIILFYVVALRDQKVSQSIFTGQAGIQFVTLFSLVIAIILFGITGVLEGKELAALLGGLAGYILGRSGITTPSQTSQRPPNEGVPSGEGGKEKEVTRRQAA